MTGTEHIGRWAGGHNVAQWEYAQLSWWIKKRATQEDEEHLRVYLPGGLKEEFSDPYNIVGALNSLGEDGWEAFATEQMNALIVGELGFGRTGYPVRRRFWLKRPVR